MRFSTDHPRHIVLPVCSSPAASSKFSRSYYRTRNGALPNWGVHGARTFFWSNGTPKNRATTRMKVRSGVISERYSMDLLARFSETNRSNPQ
jgi:hypothetical protein